MPISTKKNTSSPYSPPIKNAITLLMEDHEKVAELFQQYEKARSAAKKKSLVTKICLELSAHTQIEEEIFYPAFKNALKDKELVPEAIVEHATLKDLITQVRDKEPDGEIFDAKIKVLSEYVHHHVKEEHTEMFPKAKKSKLDLIKLGDQMAKRKQELISELSAQGVGG